MISWSVSLHRVLLPEETPHHVGTLDHPEHHHHVHARRLLPMCDVTAARAPPVLQVHHVDEAGFGVHHSEEDVITHILIRLETIPVRHLLHPRRCLHDGEALLQVDAPVVVAADDPHDEESVAVEQPCISGTCRTLQAGCDFHQVVTLERAPLDPLPFFLLRCAFS